MKSINTARIDLNLLVVFEAVFTEGSVTRASERLNLTQSAISHGLRRLRALFDDPLFTRQGHAMVPTPMARSIAESVTTALRTLDSTLSQAFTFDPGKAQRTLTIGLPGSEEMSFLPELFLRVLDTSCIDLVTLPYDRSQLEARLASGTIDMVLDILLPHSTDVHHLSLGIEQLSIMARNGHPAVNGRPSLDTYLQQQHIHVSSARPIMRLLDAELSRLTRQRRIRLRCQDYLAASQIVAKTDLILTLPSQLAAAASPYDNQIVPMPAELAMLGMELYLYWHASADGDPANRWLREHLVRIFRD